MHTRSPINYALTSGDAAGAYTASISALGTAFTDGLMLTLKWYQASTTDDATLAVNGATAIPLIKATDGTQITDTGVFAIDTVSSVFYSSTGISSSTPAWVVSGV